uniref:Protein MIS12 homolog n=2 Tax=Plectus sambesii TaxID=2011161 RepID=A0A914US93_9BILA
MSETDETNLHFTTPHEYETQFFQFSPRGFTDAVFNAVSQAAKRAIDSQLMTQLPEGTDEQMKRRLEQCILKRITRQSVFTNNLNKLEEHTLKHVFCIPKHICLPEDSVHEEEVAFDQYEIEESIKNMEDKIRGLRLLSEKCDKEKKKITDTIKVLDALEC